MRTGTARYGEVSVPNHSLDGAIVAKVYGGVAEVLEPNWLSGPGTGDRSRSAQLETLADAAQLIADLEQFRQAGPIGIGARKCCCSQPGPAGKAILRRRPDA